ncbi:ATP-dependent protease La domain-containing protein [Zychaea mexicana]|uniref:ATP-dependent protease La domain-containing protein n=1 Tax=Zychaea mexicana TaxID=64656 RepID=UPI0022FDF7CE|nr:ATP-dependent protease La domain-containing protein [Zychaea mexicana]KAI9494824.1 ATP-dependent protease La domain-containing protein [Zychaea mexicana]
MTSTFPFCSPSLVWPAHSTSNTTLPATTLPHTSSGGYLDYPSLSPPMDLFVNSLTELLQCPVCNNDLRDPVTLSCGYTVCQVCIPVPIQDRNIHQPVFICPVPDCRYSTHLFGRSQESCIDSVVQSLCLIAHRSALSICPRSSSSSSINIMSTPTSASLALPIAKGKQLATTAATATTATDAQQQVSNLLQCRKCHDTFHQPLTTHCGHVYCRLCLLKLKIEGESCPECQRPLPRYNHIQNQAADNRILARLLQLLQQHERIFQAPNTSAIPMFVTGQVILPHQHARIPVFTPSHIRMLRHAIFASRQHNALCLPAVHRGRPNLSQYGTIVQIVSVEQKTDGSTILDVRGCERFRTYTADHEEENMEDVSVLIADIDLVPEVAVQDAWTDELALQIHTFIQEIATVPPLEGVVSTSTMGLLGPLWFETMERIHGPMPARHQAAALTWWAAVILPVSGAECYALLRTINLQDRLELVLSWIKQLDGQWKRCRQTAVNTVAAAIQPQLEN